MEGHEERVGHTFIVSVSVEGLDQEGYPDLRAYVLHVLEDERDKPHYKRDLNEIAEHIAAYLQRMGVNPARIGGTVRPVAPQRRRGR
jgi:hypothetical protein